MVCSEAVSLRFDRLAKDPEGRLLSTDWALSVSTRLAALLRCVLRRVTRRLGAGALGLTEQP